MIAWLYPAAFVTLAAVALPLIVHLLLRQRSTRVVVPSVRFIVRSEESAVRVRRPSDVWLLLIRMAIVACAALALARPLLVTDARRASWNARTVRAIVVDGSASVDRTAATEAAAAESRGANAFRRVETEDLRTGIARAVAWLDAAPAARREVVLISDFQHGSLSSPIVADIPGTVGVRVVRVPSTQREAAAIDGGMVLYGSHAYAQSILLNGTTTAFTLRETRASSGLEFLKSAQTDPSMAALARTVTAAGVFAPASGAPLVVTSRPLDTFEAAAELYETLSARQDVARLKEMETERVTSTTLEGWSRAPGPADASAWRNPDDSEGRWFWLAAILLLGLETIVRRDRARPRVEETRAA